MEAGAYQIDRLDHAGERHATGLVELRKKKNGPAPLPVNDLDLENILKGDCRRVPPTGVRSAQARRWHRGPMRFMKKEWRERDHTTSSRRSQARYTTVSVSMEGGKRYRRRMGLFLHIRKSDICFLSRQLRRTYGGCLSVVGPRAPISGS